MGEVQGDGSDAIYGCDDTEHRGEWLGYVVFVGYGDGGVFGDRAEGGRGERPDGRGEFVSLAGRPSSFIHALELSKSIATGGTARRLEDGPYGGIPIYSGEGRYGESVEAPLGDYGTGWGAARILDASLAQVAYWLSRGKLWLPAEPEAVDLRMARLSDIGERGLDSQMFISKAHKGPFTRSPASATATYPSLWNHNAKNETRMVCKPRFATFGQAGDGIGGRQGLGYCESRSS